LVNRNFNSSIPNQIFSTDTTYLETIHSKTGFYYASAYIDLCGAKCLGFVARTNNDLKLGMSSIRAANIKNCISHSDRGSLYVSNDYKKYCQIHNVKQSMGRKSKSLDNRPIEFF
jgi:putative transposase